MKYLSCDTKSIVPLYSKSAASSVFLVSASIWFVGSSKINIFTLDCNETSFVVTKESSEDAVLTSTEEQNGIQI